MKSLLIRNALVFHPEKKEQCNILIEGNRIVRVTTDYCVADEEIDATGLWCLPGAIDVHVHFRDPGLTHKADFSTESQAALCGGITSVLEMPNTKPVATSIKVWKEKNAIAAEKSFTNYAFYVGASNKNEELLTEVNPSEVPAIKLFWGTSTGNMQVSSKTAIESLFRQKKMMIVIHSEDDDIINKQTTLHKQKYGENIPFSKHAQIRSAEACISSTQQILELAKKYDTQIHLAHISTKRELEMIKSIPNVSAEACIPHLWFDDTIYDEKKGAVKCNPSIKTLSDREALRHGIADGIISIVATDHAPHTFEEKQQPYFKCPSGIPTVQYSLLAMLELSKQGYFDVNKVVEVMCSNPAKRFGIEKRGTIREGFYADLVLIKPNKPYLASQKDIRSKCGWSPFEETQFSHTIESVVVNGHVAFNHGQVNSQRSVQQIFFNRR